MKVSISLILSFVAVAATVGFTTACESNTRLASRIEGSWSGTPQHINRTVVSEGTYTPVFEFSRDGKSPDGKLLMTAQLSVTMPVNAPVNETGAAPVSATCAALATVSGLWTVTDDDEVKIAFDPRTLDITLDPDIQFAVADVFTDYDTDSTATVPPAVMHAFQQQMHRAMTDIISHTDELDDIRFRSPSILSTKIGKDRITLSRP